MGQNHAFLNASPFISGSTKRPSDCFDCSAVDCTQLFPEPGWGKAAVWKEPSDLWVPQSLLGDVKVIAMLKHPKLPRHIQGADPEGLL